MNEDLEGLLRRTLQEQAGTVMSGAILAQPSGVTPVRRRRTWIVPAAAAAAVAIGVTVGTTALVGKPEGGAIGAGGEVCPARPSVAFERAYVKHPTLLGHLSAIPSLLGATLGRDRVIVTADAPSRVYRVSDAGRSSLLTTAPPGEEVVQVEASGRWVVTVTARPRFDAIGNRASTALTVIDTASGKRTVLASSSVTDATYAEVLQPRFDSLVVTHGSAYWLTRSRSDSLIAEAHRYELATGRTTSLGAMGGYRGAGQDIAQVRPVLVKTDSAVSFGVGTTPIRTLIRFAPQKLPPVVAKAFHRTYPSQTVSTDGRVYAWTSGKELLYWKPGLSQPQRFRTPVAAVVEDVNGPFVALTVVGEGTRRQLLDTRSGAALDLSDASVGFARAYDGARNGAQRLDTQPHGRVTTLYRVVASDLPPLRC
ncbi:MAG: hypothetical protein JWO22_2717 [Frankiales bacterium]|nr:hypothetical protein [Frankiales bacterium]